MSQIASRSLCIVLFFFCMTPPNYAVNKEKDMKHILLISSYFPDKENSKIIINSFSYKLSREFNCRITIEYMDSEASINFKEWENWMKELFEAYKTAPDIVVIIGGEAWTTYTTSCPHTWKNIPIVLGSVKSGYIDYNRLVPQDINDIQDICKTTESFEDFHVTGYYTKDYFKENLQLIRQLQPNASKIAYIYDNRYNFQFLTPHLQKLAKEVGFEELHPYYGSELNTMQLVDSLVSQDNTYAFLSSGWYTDAQNYSHAYSMLHNELVLQHSKFFYLIMDQGKTNPNYLGGYYVAAEDLGNDLAGLTYEVLSKGIDNSRKFQITPSRPQYYINYKILQKNNIDQSRLPVHTVLYNREPSFLKTYFWYFFAGALIISGIIIILVLRMLYYKRITTVKAHMMEEQKILREKADESNRLKSAFLANISHEIRTPLNAIVGFSSQLAYADDKEEAHAYMKIIETNNALLLQLISDILDLSKIESGQLDFHYSETDIVQVCRNLKQEYQPKIKEGISLQCELPDKECIIYTERHRLAQAISNFLSNAAKFTEKGHICFGYEHITAGLRFFVKDTGKGIADEDLPKVFARFEKIDNFTPGNGLGMSICKGIIEKMNGEIGVKSELGKGSTFWFTLPCKIISVEK